MKQEKCELIECGLRMTHINIQSVSKVCALVFAVTFQHSVIKHHCTAFTDD